MKLHYHKVYRNSDSSSSISIIYISIHRMSGIQVTCLDVFTLNTSMQPRQHYFSGAESITRKINNSISQKQEVMGMFVEMIKKKKTYNISHI